MKHLNNYLSRIFHFVQKIEIFKKLNVEFYNAIAETSGSEVPLSNTLSHRVAVLPYSTVGSRWELVSATTLRNIVDIQPTLSH